MHRYCFVFLIAVLCASNLWALETDQFTLPKGPLQDSAPSIVHAFFQTLKNIESLNPKSDEEVRELFYKKWGRGLPLTHIEKWISTGQNLSPSNLFQVKLQDSVYVGANLSLAFVQLAPTLNIYGIYLGSDKFGHFVQQGYQYYKIYHFMRARRRTPLAAQRAAVSSGVFQERTYFGTLIDGVYSNADLAANFSGLKFYINFFEEVNIGLTKIAPIFSRVNGRLKLNQQLRSEYWLKPFFSQHLSEGLNLSKYAFSQEAIRQQILKRCPDLRAHSLILSAEQTAPLATFFGEDYGFNRGAGTQFKMSELCILK